MMINDLENDYEYRHPTVSIALEYIQDEETFNFYIKRVSNCPLLFSHRRKSSRAILNVIKDLNRTTWIGKPRNITNEEMDLHEPISYRTLVVPRHTTTVFNEFFSCKIEKEEFHRSMMRIQICDVNSQGKEVAIAECSFWIDSFAFKCFKETEMAMTICTPDLGELELSITYLPTAQRLCVEKCSATNLRVPEGAEGIYYRIYIYTDGVFDEVHKSEEKTFSTSNKDSSALVFTKRLVFDLLRIDIANAFILVQCMRKHAEGKDVIGEFGISWDKGDLFKKMIEAPRTKVSEVFRLQPGIC